MWNKDKCTKAFGCLLMDKIHLATRGKTHASIRFNYTITADSLIVRGTLYLWTDAYEEATVHIMQKKYAIEALPRYPGWRVRQAQDDIISESLDIIYEKEEKEVF